MFQLTDQELYDWKKQNLSSNKENMGLRKLPYAFTEQGVAMLSSVLNSDIAIEVNIQIIRIFSRIREIISTNSDVLLKLEQIEHKLLKHDQRVQKNEDEIQIIFNALKRLLNPIQEPREVVGFMSNKK